MFKILIVEDDITIHNLIEEILTGAGYKIYNAYSGTEALMLLERNEYDLILLDLMLPAISGEEIIKQSKGTPIIVLSAKASTEDKVSCLCAGANDYITKPFDTKELLARIEVQLRQKTGGGYAKIIRYKDLELSEGSRTLCLGSKKVGLTKTEYAIIRQLMLNPTQVLTKSKLLDLIFMEAESCDENSLKVHMSNIRKKIRTLSDENYIESVYGIGFKMC